MNREIGVGNSYGSWLGKGEIDQYRYALDHYRSGFDAAFLLESLPIVPDTNVLLNHMHITQELSERTRTFLEENRERVVVTHQIDMEYERHKPEKPFLDNSKFVKLPSLNVYETDFLKAEFDTMASTIDPRRTKAELATPYKAFPGLADLKKKPDRPYGDYVILHEMMKYAATNDTDVIFLTCDVDKGDWLTAERRAYPHMIETIHLNVGHAIFILEAPIALIATLGDDTAKIPLPFTETAAFRSRFLFTWTQLKRTLNDCTTPLKAKTRRDLDELRLVYNNLVQRNVEMNDYLLDYSWLVMMEKIIASKNTMD